MNRLLPAMVALMALALVAGSAKALSASQLPLDAVIVGESINASVAATTANHHAKRVRGVLAENGISAAVAALDQIDDATAFETAAAALVSDLQAGKQSSEARAALAQLSTVSTRVYKRHDETLADWFVPVFDVRARAHYALRSWAEADQRDVWVGRFAVDTSSALSALIGANDDAQMRASEAIRTLSQADGDGLEQAMLATAADFGSPVWRAVAERSQRVATFTAAARYCSDIDLLKLMPSSQQLPADDAGQWLQDVMMRPGLTSAALLALAPLADLKTASLDSIIERLDHAAMWSSAAAALAQRPQTDRLGLIGQLLADPRASPQRLKSLAFALRLEGSERAIEMLLVLSHDDRLPVEVREELAR